MIKKQKGFTLVELIVAIALIGVIGTMVFTLVGAGRNQSRIINENFNAQSEARIAMAYITTTLRQNDTSGGIVAAVGPVLIINKGTERFIISFNGESLTERNVKDPIDKAKPIAQIEGLTLVKTDNRIQITIDYGNDKHLDSTITLRSE